MASLFWVFLPIPFSSSEFAGIVLLLPKDGYFTRLHVFGNFAPLLEIIIGERPAGHRLNRI